MYLLQNELFQNVHATNTMMGKSGIPIAIRL